MSWERWESSELGRWEGVRVEWGGKVLKKCEWSEAERWERWENSDVAWLER